MSAVLLALGLGYLIGSIPFGLVVARAAGLGDIRRIGSGNIGATNVLRTGHRGAAAATLLLDALKGAAAVWLVWHLWGHDAALVAGAGAMLGHAFPVWLGFRGGKGVATGLGVLFAAAWWLALATGAVWAGVALTTRISSAGALAACAAAPVLAALLGDWRLALMALALAGLITLRHRGNIERLLAGTEPRIGGAK